MVKKAKKKGGPPLKMTPQAIKKLMKLARMGLSNAQLAAALDIDVTTLDVWRKKSAKFKSDLKEAKTFADEQIKASLFQRACGYTHPEERIFNERGRIIRANTTKQYPPDTEAIKFWLTNRQPEEWSNKQRIELPEETTINVTIKQDPEQDA